MIEYVAFLVFVGIISIVLTIVVFCRWWRMTSDINDIRNKLCGTDKSITKPLISPVEDMKEMLEIKRKI